MKFQIKVFLGSSAYLFFMSIFATQVRRGFQLRKITKTHHFSILLLIQWLQQSMPPSAPRNSNMAMIQVTNNTYPGVWH